MATAAPLSFLAMSPAGDLVAGCSYVVSKGTAIHVLDGQGRPVRQIPTASSCYLAFTPDGKWLAAGSAKEYCFYRVGTWEKGLTIPRRSNLPGPLTFSPDGRLMAVLPSNLVVRLVDPATGAELATLTPPERGIVSCLAFSPDGGQLAVSTESGWVYLWDLRAVWARLAEMGLAEGLPALPLERRADPERGGPLRAVVEPNRVGAAVGGK